MGGGTPLVAAGGFLFTAKELDPETGFYDFGARYLNPRFSKWMSTDPALGKYLPETSKVITYQFLSLANKWRTYPDLVGMGGTFQPTNLALYGYSHHNPATLSDPTGLWSPAAHDRILQVAFTDRLTAADIQILQRSSREFDSANQGFTADQTARHSMRALGQTPADAIATRDAFIDRTIAQAKQLNEVEDRAGALNLLGQALHPIMDASSPEHTTRDGQPRLWSKTHISIFGIWA